MKPSLSPFMLETAIAKIQAAANARNTDDPVGGALAYPPDSEWHNRAEFLSGREVIKAFLKCKWAKELDYPLKKELRSLMENAIAMRFKFKWHNNSDLRYRTYGNENRAFAENELMRRRFASINDVSTQQSNQTFCWGCLP